MGTERIEVVRRLGEIEPEIPGAAEFLRGHVLEVEVVLAGIPYSAFLDISVRRDAADFEPRFVLLLALTGGENRDRPIGS